MIRGRIAFLIVIRAQMISTRRVHARTRASMRAMSSICRYERGVLHDMQELFVHYETLG